MTPFRLALLNLFRRPLSTGIAIFGIATAVGSSSSLLKMYLLSQSRFQTLAAEGQSLIGAKAGGIEILLGGLNLEGPPPGFLPQNLYVSLKGRQALRFEDGAESRPSYLKAVIPFLYFARLEDYRVLGTSEDFFRRPVEADSPQFAEGTWAPGEVVAGSHVAGLKALRPGSSVRVETVLGAVPRGHEMKISGVLKPTGKIWDYALFTSLEAGQKTLSDLDLAGRSIWGRNVVHYVLLYHDAAGAEALKSLIDQRTVGQMIAIDDQIERLRSLTGTGKTFGFLLTCLILFLSGSSVASMMVARFEAMSSQLAILRAIGYRRSEIARWLLWEGVILGVLACAIGAAVDLAVFPWIRGASGLELPSYVPSPFLRTSILWLATIAVTVAAVMIPLLRLYRQDVNASLKA